MAEVWSPGYICILTQGCRGRDHSMSCQDKNAAYARAARVQERKRREQHMDAVIRGDAAYDDTGGTHDHHE